MNKLLIFVCENYLPEFQYLIDNNDFENVEIVSFKSLCDGRCPVSESLSSIEDGIDTSKDAVLVCSHLCRVPHKYGMDKDFSRIYQSSYCYSNMISDSLAHFFLKEGYYIITTGWLNNWEEHIQIQGFTQDTAREFYKLTCNKLLFLDTEINDKAEEKLKALSVFLDIPAETIPVSLEPIRNLINAIISDRKVDYSTRELKALRELNAQNSAILNIMSQIAGIEYKRDVITMLDQIWKLLFGAVKSHFWSFEKDEADVPQEIKALEFSHEKQYLLNHEKNALYALLESGGEKFGIIEVGDFMFPENIKKYTEMFNSIAKIAALAISNAQRYEQLVLSKNNYEYSSYHDGLTGLFNRAYYNKIVQESLTLHIETAFSIDVDGLKLVNDTIGHSEGDVLIIRAAEVLKKTFRESDYIFRMGGDEFTVLVNDCNQHLAENLEKRLQLTIEKLNKKNSLKLSLSSGFFVSSIQNYDLKKIVQTADMNMYKEKRRRKEEHKLL